MTDKRTKPKNRKGIFLRLSKYVLQQWPLFIIALLLTLGANQLSLLGPRYSGTAIDAIQQSGGVDFGVVFKNIGFMLGCYVISAVLSYVLSVTMIQLSQRIIYKMRKQVFEKLTTLPVSYFDTHATGDIISHLSYDIDTINSTLSHDLIQIMTSIYTVVGSLAFMWQISKPMILIFVLTVPASLLFTRYRSQKVRPLFRKRAKKYGELNGFAEEMLTGSRTISAYGTQDVISSRFNTINDQAMDAFYKAEYNGALLFPTINLINNISLTLVAIMGGILYMFSQNGAVLTGSVFFITLGGVAQFVQYSRKFAGPINEFSNILHEIQSAFSAAERVFAILDEEPEKADASDAKELKDVTGNVELCDVLVCIAVILCCLFSDKIPFPEYITNKLHFIPKLQYSLSIYRKHKKQLLLSSLDSLWLQLLTLFTSFAYFKAVGVDINIGILVVFTSITIVVAMLPVSLNGIGVREGVQIALFSGILGIPAHLVLAAGLLGYIPLLFQALQGAVVLVGSKKD